MDDELDIQWERVIKDVEKAEENLKYYNEGVMRGIVDLIINKAVKRSEEKRERYLK